MFRGVQVTNAHTALSVVSRTGWGNVGECRGKCSCSTAEDGEWNRGCADQGDLTMDWIGGWFRGEAVLRLCGKVWL